MLGASGLSQEDLKESGPDVNNLALATATLLRMPKHLLCRTGYQQ